MATVLIALSAWWLDATINQFMPDILSVLVAVVFSTIFWLTAVSLGMIAWRKFA